MKKYYWISGIIVLTIWFFVNLGNAQQLTAPNSRDNRTDKLNNFKDQYHLILDRNIFTRNRGKKPEAPKVKVEAPPPPPVQKSYVLNGISRWGEEYIAFVEDMRYGGTQMYRIGSTVANMKIKNITLDSVELEKDAKTNTIQIGSNLIGEQQASGLTMQELIDISDGSSIPSTISTESTEPTETESMDTDDVLKKLLERRKKELGQQ